VQVHRFDDRRGKSVADELLPSRECAPIDWDPLAVKRVFESEQRHPLADVPHDDVCRQRRGAAIEPGSISGGIAAVMMSVLPSASTVLYRTRAVTTRTLLARRFASLLVSSNPWR